MLEELAALHPVPAKIVEYRGLAKLKGTYIDALPALVQPARRAACTPTFNQAVAATGRLSSQRSEPPEHPHPHRARAAHPRGLRRAAGLAHRLRPTTRRSSCASWRTSRTTRRSWTRSARAQDIHTRTAAEVFGVRAGGGHAPSTRRIAKAINFGLVYGQSEFGLAPGAAHPARPGARRTSRATSSATRASASTWSETHRDGARARASARRCSGRRRPLPDIRSTRRAGPRRRRAHRAATRPSRARPPTSSSSRCCASSRHRAGGEGRRRRACC